ncbi:MAG: hypothetical protein ACXQT3_01560 [Methermicoccaceae archaeon]
MRRGTTKRERCLALAVEFLREHKRASAAQMAAWVNTHMRKDFQVTPYQLASFLRADERFRKTTKKGDCHIYELVSHELKH